MSNTQLLLMIAERNMRLLSLSIKRQAETHYAPVSDQVISDIHKAIKDNAETDGEMKARFAWK